MSTFPTAIDSFNTPVGSDLLENVDSTLDHHTQHNDSASAIIAVETYLGIDGSTDPASLDYLLRTGQLLEHRPSSPHSHDDEFDGTSLDGKWTLHNSGGGSTTETLTFTDSHLVFGMPACTSGDKNRLLTQAAPSGVDWCIEIKGTCSCHPSESGYFHTGLVLYDATGGRYTTFGINYRANIYQIGEWIWTYPTTYYTSGFGETRGTQTIYLRVYFDDATDFIQLLMSFDGVFYEYVHIPSRSSRLTNKPTHYGITVMGNNLQYPASFAIDYFRRIL